MRIPFAGANNPMMAEYLSRNPKSVFAMQRQPPSFAAGGMMSAQGMPIRPGQPMPHSNGEPELGAASPAPMDGKQMDQEAQNFVRSNPQVAQQIQQVMVQAMQSGQLTPDELNMAVQLAKAALANPASYPQVRQFAIQNGLGTEADIPPEMDRGVLFTLIVIGKTLQGGTGVQGNAVEGQAPAATENAGLLPEYKEGGMTGDKPHIAKLHARGYVIPEDALVFWGKNHFDKLIEKARTPKDDSTT